MQLCVIHASLPSCEPRIACNAAARLANFRAPSWPPAQGDIVLFYRHDRNENSTHIARLLKHSGSLRRSASGRFDPTFERQKSAQPRGFDQPGARSAYWREGGISYRAELVRFSSDAAPLQCTIKTPPLLQQIVPPLVASGAPPQGAQ